MARVPLLGALLSWPRLAQMSALCLAMFGAPAAWAGKPPNIDPAVATGERAGRDAALIIGNEGYRALPQAVWATDDARSFRGWAEVTRGISKRRIEFATDVDLATLHKLARRASWRVRSRGTLWVYFAGHGTVNDEGKRVLLPVDADAGNLESRAYTLEKLVATVRKTKRAARVVVILDAGFGNTARDGFDLIPGREIEVPVGFPTSDERVVYLAADTGAGRAGPFEPAKHGLFTWNLLGALRGWADGEIDGERDGRVTLEEAQLHGRRVGRQLHRAVSPWQETRATHRSWTLAQGDHLEPGPDEALVAELGADDLARRMHAVEEGVRADARAFWEDTIAQAREAGEGGREVLAAYISEFEDITVSLTWALPVPEVREARRLYATWDQQIAAPDPGTVAAPPMAVEEEDASCDDMMLLESPAMLGELSIGRQRCVDDRISVERLQTDKDKLSRLLLVNASASGDRGEWERLMVRHLEDIDRSDPDLCFSYAVHLHKSKDVENSEEALRWADTALENKQRWEGDAHVRKVYGLLRLRAEAANRLWQGAEKRYQREGGADNDADVRDFRGLAKDTAREWLDFARAGQQPIDTAYQMCISAAGTRDFCRSTH
jgi:hypothetical protein